MTSNNLCDSCSNYGCEFQSGIIRTKCAFYMPPHIESDNCGNYVVMQPTVNVLDEIKAEINELYSYVEFDENIKTSFNMVRLEEVQKVIDKYRAESEGKE